MGIFHIWCRTPEIKSTTPPHFSASLGSPLSPKLLCKPGTWEPFLIPFPTRLNINTLFCKYFLKISQGSVHFILTTFVRLGHYYLTEITAESSSTCPWLQSNPKMQIWYYFPNLKLPMAPSDLRMKSEHLARAILCFTSLAHFLAFSSQLPCPRFSSLAKPNSYFLQGNGPSVG